MAKSKVNKFDWGGIHPFSYHPLIFHLVPPVLKDKHIVDCGCGKGIWGFLIRSTRDLGKKGKLTGIDINSDYLKICKNHNIYDKLINSDVSKLPIENESVDFLICSEVIEHLNKIDGKKFLKEIDRVLKKGGRAIITTPSVEVSTSIEEGPDSHSSIWSANMFKKYGYKVYGMGICISPGINKWYTVPVLALGYMLTPISYFFPSLGGYMIAVKDF